MSNLVTMKYDLVPNSCRICLRKCRKSRSLYQALHDGDETPCAMLQKITGQPLDMTETLPKEICKKCELSLNLAYQFHIKLVKSQRIIQIYLKHTNPNNESMSKTSDRDFEIESHDEFISMCGDGNSEEPIEETETKTNHKDGETDADWEDFDQNAEYLETYFLLDDESEESTEVGSTIHASESNDSKAESETASQTIEVKEATEDPESFETEENCDKTESMTNKQTFRLKVITTKDDAEEQRKCTQLDDNESKANAGEEKGHICDVCGNTYAKRGRMMEHRRRHDKEMRYACEICDKRFHLRENMRKHMFIHLGGKPYKCSFCSRTFFYESVKKAHEAVHKGVRPYICEICKKSFAYAHALKKHQMIHDEIKLYHCDYCDKDFRLQHHMKQHEETKMHQNAVAKATKSTAAENYKEDTDSSMDAY